MTSQILTRYSICLLVLFTGFVISPSAKTKGRSHLKCSQRHLEQKNCLLRAGDYVVELTGEKILLNDGAWRGVEEMPLKGQKKVDWETARLRPIGSRLLLEIKLWDEPQGEAEIQSLHWYVLEVQGVKLHSLLHELISKRRPLPGEDSKKKFLQDKVEPHGLKPLKNKKIQWWAGTQKGHLKKAQAPATTE